MPTFLNPTPAATIIAATGPHTLGLIVDLDTAAAIAAALEDTPGAEGRARPAGYDYGRSTLAGEIWAALERLEP